MGITLVVLVLIFFLGRPSMALLVAMTIPFALVFALVLLYLTNIPIGLLSIGAIDFGIIVDGAVIMAENLARRLGESGRHDARGTLAVIRGAALDMQRPVVHLRRADHGGVPAAVVPDADRRAPVPAHGDDYPLRLAGRLDLRLGAGAGAGVVSLPPRLPRVGESAVALVHSGLCLGHPGIAQQRGGWWARRRLPRWRWCWPCWFRGWGPSSCRTWTRERYGSGRIFPRGRPWSRPASTAGGCGKWPWSCPT